ncbi:hypothetical protein DEJ32_14760 [Curtobacterium sp. MCPF17_046]|nr:hypothetical protein DEJ32_14760 [Curtobacterium sp. MCPF17_046]
MRTFAAAWPDRRLLQQAVAQLPWGHVTVLLDRLDDAKARDSRALHVGRSFYPRQCEPHGRFRSIPRSPPAGTHPRVRRSDRSNRAVVDPASRHRHRVRPSCPRWHRHATAEASPPILVIVVPS